MLTLCCEDFLKSSPSGRLLALDVGEKKIGLALSDVSRLLAHPLSVIERKKWINDAACLKQVITTNDIKALVVGWPLNMNGSSGPRCQSIRQFAENFSQLYAYPILFWDERLSTAAVTRVLLEADVSRKKRRAVVDKLAACYILQGALDGLQSCKNRLSAAP